MPRTFWGKNGLISRLNYSAKFLNEIFNSGSVWHRENIYSVEIVLFCEKKLFPEKLTESLPVRLKGKYRLYLRSGAVPLP